MLKIQLVECWLVVS